MALRTFLFILAVTLAIAQTPIEPEESDILDVGLMDTDQDGFVRFEEFKAFIGQLPMLKDHYQPKEIEELTQAAFEMFDENHDSTLDNTEYKKLLQHMGQLEQPNANEDSQVEIGLDL